MALLQKVSLPQFHIGDCESRAQVSFRNQRNGLAHTIAISLQSSPILTFRGCKVWRIAGPNHEGTSSAEIRVIGKWESR